MKRRIAWMTAFLVTLAAAPLAGQAPGANRLFGRITMPPAGKKGIVSRGEAYRNRTNPAAADEKAETDETNNPDRNVVIALFPLDFNAVLEPTPNAVLRQENKTFLPHVLPVTRGTTVIIENGDEFYHNVFSITPGAKFNIGRRPPGNRRPQPVDKAGEVKVFCDIHPQMNATILSLETPYFVRVDPTGGYRLERLPDGKYRIEVYHPEGGVLRREVQLRGGGAQEQNFDYRSGAAAPAGSAAYEPVPMSCCQKAAGE